MLFIVLIYILTLPSRCFAESTSLLYGATCAPFVTASFYPIYPCENLIDGNGLTKLTSTDAAFVNSDFTYKLDGVKGIGSVYVENR